jgi:hypothetical protein
MRDALKRSMGQATFAEVRAHLEASVRIPGEVGH